MPLPLATLDVAVAAPDAPAVAALSPAADETRPPPVPAVAAREVTAPGSDHAVPSVDVLIAQNLTTRELLAATLTDGAASVVADAAVMVELAMTVGTAAPE